MKLGIEKNNTCYLGDTTIENIFISEYMPDAPCDFVKVYLLSLLYAQMGGEISKEGISKHLRIDVEVVDKAFEYWKKSGLIKKDDREIVFLSMKERLYGSPKENQKTPIDKSAKLLDNGEISNMFNKIENIAKIFISGGQMKEILSWIEDDNATPEVIIKAFEYGKERGKVNLNYVGSIVRSWTEKGIDTGELAEKYLSEMDETYYIHRRVMKALGFNRNPGEKEREIISSWINEMGCSMDEILDACGKTSGISNPNINYVNKVLRNKRVKKTGKVKVSRKDVMQQYEKLRNIARSKAAQRKQEVYDKIPRIREIDEDIVNLSVEMTKNLTAGRLSANEKVSGKAKALEKEKSRLMTENNIPQGYMDPKYNCPICKDTGLTESGQLCCCYEEISDMVRNKNK